MLRLITAWVAGLMLALLYLYAAVVGIGNLIGVKGGADLLGVGLSGIGWAWLIVGILFPLVLLGLALWLGRRRTAWARILLLAAGIAVVAALQIDMMHLIPVSSYFG